MSRLFTALVAALLPAWAWAQKPHSMLFRFDRAALYGPIDTRGTLYPAEERPPALVGRPVLCAVDDVAAGEWLLRLPFEETQLPVGARPAAVRVVRRTWWGWEEAASRLRMGNGGKHSLYVRVEHGEAVYAVVLGARAEAPPARDVLVRELRRFNAFVEAESGVDAGRSFRSEDLAAICGVLGVDAGRVTLLRSNAGARAAGVLHGLLGFFESAPDGFPGSVTIEARPARSTIYLLAADLFRGDVPRRRLVETLAAALFRAEQQRRLAGAYLETWAEQMLQHGLEKHPLELEVEKKAAEAAGRLAAPSGRER